MSEQTRGDVVVTESNTGAVRGLLANLPRHEIDLTLALGNLAALELMKVCRDWLKLNERLAAPSPPPPDEVAEDINAGKIGICDFCWHEGVIAYTVIGGSVACLKCDTRLHPPPGEADAAKRCEHLEYRILVDGTNKCVICGATGRTDKYAGVPIWSSPPPPGDKADARIAEIRKRADETMIGDYLDDIAQSRRDCRDLLAALDTATAKVQGMTDTLYQIKRLAQVKYFAPDILERVDAALAQAGKGKR